MPPPSKADAERRDDDWTPYGPAIAIYDYVDERGELLFQVWRTADKQFPQVPQRIRSEKVLSKETEADLKRAIEGFNQQFTAAKR